MAKLTRLTYGFVENPTANVVVIESGSNDAIRITQTGSGNVFVVEDSTSPDATPFIIKNDGRVGIGTANPSAPLHVTANAYFGTSIQIGANNVFHQGNDGAGSGLDADTVDGVQLDTFRGEANTANTRAIAAYNQANTTDSRLNSAYATANATDLRLTSAYGAVNANAALAVVIFSTANTIDARLTSAYGTVNVSLSTAQSAFALANGNFIRLTSAFTQANLALSVGQGAFAKGNTEGNRLDTVFGNANAETLRLTSAFAAGNLTYTYAQSIYGVANATNIRLTSAFDFSNTVNSRLTSAYNAANTTDNRLTSAFASGNIALSTAQSAYALANIVQDAILSNTLSILGGTIQGNLTLTPTAYLLMNEEIQSNVPNFLRSTNGNTGVIFRNDGESFYLLLTNPGNKFGTFNSLRPFAMNVITGTLTFDTAIVITNDFSVDDDVLITGSAPRLRLNDTTVNHAMYALQANANVFSVLVDRNSDGTFETYVPLELNGVSNTATLFGATVWTANTDGVSSGLDADLVQGVSGATLRAETNTALSLAQVAFAKGNTEAARLTSAYGTVNTNATNITTNAATLATAVLNISTNAAALTANSIRLTSAFATVNATDIRLTSAFTAGNTTDARLTSAFAAGNATLVFAQTVFGNSNAVLSYAQTVYAAVNVENDRLDSAYGTLNTAVTNITTNAATLVAAVLNISTNAAALTANSIRLTSAFATVNATDIRLTSAYGQANTTDARLTSAYANANLTFTYAQGVYGTTNTALSLAQVAFAKGNTEGTRLTSAYGTVNTNATNITTNAAALVANSIRLTSAFAQANLALSTGQGAFAVANAAAADIASDVVLKTGSTMTGNLAIVVADNNNAALRVTQTGTGHVVIFEDSANPDSTPFIVANSGKVLIGIAAANTGSYTEQFTVAGMTNVGGVQIHATGNGITFAHDRKIQITADRVFLANANVTANVFSFYHSDANTAQLVVSANCGSDYQISTVNILNAGANNILKNEYGLITSNGVLATYSGDMYNLPGGPYMIFQATPTRPNTTISYKVVSFGF